MLRTMMRPLLTMDRDTWPEGGKKVDELLPLCTETKVRFVAETALFIILLAQKTSRHKDTPTIAITKFGIATSSKGFSDVKLIC